MVPAFTSPEMIPASASFDETAPRFRVVYISCAREGGNMEGRRKNFLIHRANAAGGGRR
jgi:hypothetical protein